MKIDFPRMDKTVRYHAVPLDDDEIPPQGIPPPAYEETDSGAGASGEAVAVLNLNDDGAQPGSSRGRPLSPPPPLDSCDEDSEGKLIQSSDGEFVSPPPYSEAAAELPSYEEAQRSKGIDEDDEDRAPQDPGSLFSTRDHDILGTDFLFFISFFVAFLFSWVGFLLLLCFCHTLAGRYGALAGFGLSLAKWTLIVKHSTDLVSSENEWLWWIIMAFGILICARATLQYIHAKREWRLLNPLNRERLFFFY